MAITASPITAVLGLWGTLVEKCESAVDSGIYAAAVAADIGTDAICGVFNPGSIFSPASLASAGIGGKLGTVLGLWGTLVEDCEAAVDAGIYAAAAVADIVTDAVCGVFNPLGIFSDLLGGS